MTDLEEYKKWSERVYHFKFDSIQSTQEFKEIRKKIFNDYSLDEDGDETIVLKGTDRSGQYAAKNLFRGGPNKTPWENNEAAEVWANLVSEEQGAAEAFKSIIRDAERDLNLTKINLDSMDLPELQQTAKDYTEKRKQYTVGADDFPKQQKTLTQQLLENINNANTNTQLKNSIRDLTANLRELEYDQRNNILTAARQKAQEIPDTTQLLSQIGRAETNTNKILISRILETRRLQTQPLEDAVKTTKTELLRYGYTPTEINQLKSTGQLPKTPTSLIIEKAIRDAETFLGKKLNPWDRESVLRRLKQ